jgi:hypothetical protein
MPTDIGKRVSDSFDDKDYERVTKYMDWILSSMTAINQNVQRRTAAMLLLIAVFEVVAQSPKTSISLLGFGIARNSIVFTFIPTIVAYLYFQVMIDTVKADRLVDAIGSVFRKWSPRASANNLEAFLAPPSPLYWNQGIPVSSDFQSKFDRLEDRTSMILILVLFFGVLGFEAHAFYTVFSSNLSKDVLWFINVCISLSLIICGLLSIARIDDAQIAEIDHSV